MTPRLKVSFVAAVNNREILNANLLASPCLQGLCEHEVIIQEGFFSAAKAYNSALEHCVNDIVIFVHQDVFLPENWIEQVQKSLDVLSRLDPTWGVIGCFGATQTGQGVGHVYTVGQGVVGQSFDKPIAVQTLDEIVLILRKSAGLRFDEGLNHFHFYGADICLTAASLGRRSYAISAFCIHNFRWYSSYPEEFYRGYKYIKSKWGHSLPIQTSCIRISTFDYDYYRRKLRAAVDTFLNPNAPERADRVSDPRRIEQELRANGQLAGLVATEKNVNRSGA